MRTKLEVGERMVVKIGSSSLMQDDTSGLNRKMISQVSRQVASSWEQGFPTVLVTSGSVAAGLPALGLDRVPTDIAELQVAAAVGQGELLACYSSAFAKYGLVTGQVLLTKDVLANRNQYLNARQALAHMLNSGIVPVVNENDTVVVDELKLGDNDRLAAMVAQLVTAQLLVILTDTSGLFSSDPRQGDAELLEAVRHNDQILDRVARGQTGPLGSGGPGTKVVAARMAAWAGIPTVVIGSDEPDGVERARSGENIGTWIKPNDQPLAARKIWIAFGQAAEGEIAIDAGAVQALLAGGASLLPVGVTEVRGKFDRGAAVEVFGPQGDLIAKGITRHPSSFINQQKGQRFPKGAAREVVHRDDLIVLSA